MTSQGHARTTFYRAIERGNLLLAELTAREIGQVSLAEALELTALIAKHDPPRRSRAATRWLRRYLDETGSTLEDLALAVSCLAALGDLNHDEALTTLRAMTDRGTRRRPASIRPSSG